jgi:hypothetical protein
MTDLLQIIQNLVAVMDDLKGLVGGICFLIGFLLGIKAIKMAQKRQEQGAGQGGWGASMSTFITACFFLSLPGLINILNTSVFGVNPVAASSIFTYADSTIGAINNAAAREMITGLVIIIQFMGIIAVGRGLFLLNQSAQGSQGPSTFGPGLTFVISGLMATNFPLFVGIMESLITAP